MATHRERSDTLAALAAGLVLFVAAVLVARATLPEWRSGKLPPADVLEERFREIGAAAGVDLSGGDVRLELSSGFETGPENPYAALGAGTPEWLLEEHRPLRVEASGAGTTAEGLPVFVSVDLGLDGRPWKLGVSRASLTELFTPRWEAGLPTPEGILLRPGERLGAAVDGLYNGNAARLYPILGAGGATEPPQYLSESALEKAPATFVARGVGDVTAARAAGLGDWWPRALGKIAANVLLFTLVVILAFVLALGRRIDFVNASWLTALAVLVSAVAAVASGSLASMEWFEHLFLVGVNAAYLFFLWATAESLVRDAAGEPTNALDLLRRGHLDRRVGRAVVWGIGAGAAMAALGLLAQAFGTTGADLASAFRPERASLLLPPFEPGRSPFDHGIRQAGEVLLATAVAHRLLPGRWVLPVALGLATLIRLAGSHQLATLGGELVVTLLFVALLLAAFRRAGSLAVLVAGVSAYLLPAFVFSAAHASWLGGSLAASALTLLALGAAGFVGLRRGDVERHEVAAPSFLARIEEERRVRYEMELLARMQLGLLPEAVPVIPGWQVAARSMLAHEVGGDFYDFFQDDAGRLWIAAGDVAGHGSFCSISHAMTKAALASLVAAERTPGQVLEKADRVLRSLGARRIFTSLALLRLDPGTGQALLANAGYPFPLVRGNGREAADGAIREIVLPGLPLGQGPARSYADVAVELAPGESLVLSSDGLFEATGRDGRPYGFDRYHAGLEKAPAGSADELLEHLLDHWRNAVGAGPLEDDTTLVVLRRKEEAMVSPTGFEPVLPA